MIAYSTGPFPEPRLIESGKFTVALFIGGDRGGYARASLIYPWPQRAGGYRKSFYLIYDTPHLPVETQIQKEVACFAKDIEFEETSLTTPKRRAKMKKFLGLFLALALVLAPVFVGAQVLRGDFVQVELLSSAARVGPGTGSTVSRMHNFKDAIILLNMVAATAQNSETHAVRIQTSPDSGTTWLDIMAFAAHTGITVQAAVSDVIQWTSMSVTTALQQLPAINKNIAAGTVNHGPAGPLWRVVWGTSAVTSTGTWHFGVTGFFRAFK